MSVLAPKTPAEVRTVTYDWSDFLGDDTISASELVAEGVDLNTATFDGTTVTFVISGGDEGTAATVTNTITTALGQVEAETFTILVAEADATTSLVTLAEAKTRLRLTDDDDWHEPNVEMKMVQATDIVLNYIKRTDNVWNETTAPPLVKAAILEVINNLFQDADPLSVPVKNLLHGLRVPTLA